MNLETLDWMDRNGYRPFHSKVISAAAGEAPYVLDGLVGNAAEFDPLGHHVGTGGVVPGPDCSLNVILDTNLPMTPEWLVGELGRRWDKTVLSEGFVFLERRDRSNRYSYDVTLERKDLNDEIIL